ncbi:MAG: DUF302 domain-containing protein [Magnetococcales bacterium]|nr:DUF302 domain-containing protein [Magnetococcales bacterium]
MKKSMILTIIFWLFAIPALADSTTVVKQSQFGVTQTLDRLEGALKKKGVTIFARINHAKGAKNANLVLPPTQLLIFGNPKLGTPLMQENGAIGLDLPMKVVAWQDSNSQVWLAYTKPSSMAKRHSITINKAIITKMSKVLNTLTNMAAGVKK